jgi:hypothetical protein
VIQVSNKPLSPGRQIAQYILQSKKLDYVYEAVFDANVNHFVCTKNYLSKNLSFSMTLVFTDLLTWRAPSNSMNGAATPDRRQ